MTLIRPPSVRVTDFVLVEAVVSEQEGRELAETMRCPNGGAYSGAGDPRLRGHRIAAGGGLDQRQRRPRPRRPGLGPAWRPWRPGGLGRALARTRLTPKRAGGAASRRMARPGPVCSRSACPGRPGPGRALSACCRHVHTAVDTPAQKPEKDLDAYLDALPPWTRNLSATTPSPITATSTTPDPQAHLEHYPASASIKEAGSLLLRPGTRLRAASKRTVCSTTWSTASCGDVSRPGSISPSTALP